MQYLSLGVLRLCSGLGMWLAYSSKAIQKCVFNSVAICRSCWTKEQLSTSKAGINKSLHVHNENWPTVLAITTNVKAWKLRESEFWKLFYDNIHNKDFRFAWKLYYQVAFVDVDEETTFQITFNFQSFLPKPFAKQIFLLLVLLFAGILFYFFIFFLSESCPTTFFKINLAFIFDTKPLFLKTITLRICTYYCAYFRRVKFLPNLPSPKTAPLTFTEFDPILCIFHFAQTLWKVRLTATTLQTSSLEISANRFHEEIFFWPDDNDKHFVTGKATQKIFARNWKRCKAWSKFLSNMFASSLYTKWQQERLSATMPGNCSAGGGGSTGGSAVGGWNNLDNNTAQGCCFRQSAKKKTGRKHEC